MLNGGITMETNPFEQPFDDIRMNKVAYYVLHGILFVLGIFFIVQGFAQLF